MNRKISFRDLEDYISPLIRQGFCIRLDCEDKEQIYAFRLRYGSTSQGLFNGLLDLPESYLSMQCGGINKIAAVKISLNSTEKTSNEVVEFLQQYQISPGSFPQITWELDKSLYILFQLENPPPGSYVDIQPEIIPGRLIYGPESNLPLPLCSNTEIVSKLFSTDFTSLPTISFSDYLWTSNEYLYDVQSSHNNMDPSISEKIVRKYLNQKDKEDYEIEQSIITKLILKGYFYTDIWNIFVNEKPKFFQEMYVKDPHDADDYLINSFGKAYEHLNRIDEDDVTSHVVVDNLEYLLNTPWPGKDGPSRKAVYLAHLLIAYRSHKTQYSASVRELAEMAGVCISTASKANTKLVSDGFLKIIRKSSGDFPAIYELENKHTYLHSNQYVRLFWHMTPFDAVPWENPAGISG